MLKIYFLNIIIQCFVMELSLFQPFLQLTEDIGVTQKLGDCMETASYKGFWLRLNTSYLCTKLFTDA